MHKNIQIPIRKEVHLHPFRNNKSIKIHSASHLSIFTTKVTYRFTMHIFYALRVIFIVIQSSNLTFRSFTNTKLPFDTCVINIY